MRSKKTRGNYFLSEKTISYWQLAAESRQPNKKPIGRLLGACSGQHPMGYRFSLLTLLFSGVCKKLNPTGARSSV
jgi:hypothetical protein